MSRKHFSEEALIDFALGEVSEDHQQEIREHLEDCPKCKKVTEDWLEVFNQPSSVQPSTALKNRIWENVKQRQAPRKKQQPLIMAMSGAAAVFLLFIGLLIDNRSNLQRYEVAHNDEIGTESIQTNPQTEHLTVVPVADFHDIKGNLWVNGVNQEMLLEVDGLADLSDRDYQLWMIYDNDEIKGELLSTVDGSSRIMIKGTDVKQFRIIKASIEPIGGSLAPTGPEAFVVQLK